MTVSLWITTERLHPNRTGRMWLLQSGSMAVFAIAANAKDGKGKRRYLFTVRANEALFEMQLDQRCPHKILAIELEPTVLSEMTLSQAASADADFPLDTLVTRWGQSLHSVFIGTSLALTTDINRSTQMDGAPWQIQLATLHTEFFETLAQLAQLELEQTFHRLQQRETLNRQSAETALEGLVNVIQGEQTGSWKLDMVPDTVPDKALLSAAGAVGRSLGIAIQAPAAFNDWERHQDPVEAIAQASRIRMQRVSLESDWWKYDQGPLLGYTYDDRPVALLPSKSGQYELFDPDTHTRTPLSRHTVKTLSPIAYIFYRSLPDRALSIWDIAKFIWRGQTKDYLSLGWIGVAATLTGMVTPFVTGILIDQAIPDANRQLLFQLGFGLLAANLGVAAFQFVQDQVLLRVQTAAELTTQAAIWDRLLKLKLSFFRQYSTGDLTNRVSAISEIQELLGGQTLSTLLTSLFSLLNLFLLFFYSPNLAWIAVWVAAVSVLATNTINLIALRQFRALQTLDSDLFSVMAQIIGGISKLRVAGAENRAFAYWAKQYGKQLKLVINTQVLEDGLAVFNTVLPTLSSILFFWVAVSLITPAEAQASSLSTGAFLAFNSAFGIFMAGVTSLSNLSINLSQARILWERGSPILTAEPEVDDSKVHPGELSGHVKLDSVAFRYQVDGPWVLDQITLEAKAGEFIALVGPSGSGKSTLINLMLGFETPEQGAIYYNGQDLSKLDLTAVRRQLGVVLQDARITSASLMENITAGAQISLDDIWEAARLAGFADDIQAMPMGMHTVISEGGSNLSGGQRQRLLIARSLVLNPKILILDEATSALDNQTQALISHNLGQMKVTRIAIAHRLSTIRHADRIYVLENGRIVQQGDFEQLMQQPGVFQHMMTRQISGADAQ